MQDDKQFTALAEHLEADLLADLATYDIQDRATLKSYFGTLASLALQRGDYKAAVAYQDRVGAIEDKPGLRLVAGLVERAMATAADTPAHGTSTGPRPTISFYRPSHEREILEKSTQYVSMRIQRKRRETGQQPEVAPARECRVHYGYSWSATARLD